MTEQLPRRVAIGVWAALERPVDFVSEGMTRLLGFLVEGAAEQGRVTLHVFVRPINEQSARTLLEGARAREGQDWTLQLIMGDPPPAPEAATGTDAAAPPGEPADASPPVVGPAAASTDPAPLPYSERTVGVGLFLLGVAFAPIGVLLAFARWLFRPFWRHGLRLATATLRDPVGNAPEVGVGLRRLRLPAFRRLADRLDAWAAVHRAPDLGTARHPAEAVASCPEGPGAPRPRTERVDFDVTRLDAWLSLFPDLIVAPEIPGRRALIFPDALMLDFGGNWPERELRPDGGLDRWLHDVRANLAVAESVITFSAHVAARHAVAGFGVDPGRIAIVPHASPDSAHLLPFLPPDGRRTAESWRMAADMLRANALAEFSALPARVPERPGFERARADSRRLRYLAGFPFEHVTYIAVSTRERPSKNFPIAVEALRILLQERFADVKLITTGRLLTPQDDPYAAVAATIVRDQGLMLDVVEMPNLPNPVHAAFYHAAAITVHPAFFEGGDAPFPFSESVSVGTPCIMARGPHVEELLGRFPELAPFVFEPFDPEALADLIARGIAERAAWLDIQRPVLARMRERRWSRVVEEYAAAASGIPLVPLRRLPGA